MGQRALLLINRNARRGNETAIVGSLERVGVEVVEESSAPSRNVTDIIRRHRHAVNLVIVAGGDGSLNAAAPGLVETGLPLGILPLGTANDLARTLALPVDLSEACAVIAKGNVRRIDLGQANDKYFFNAASVGISARIARALDARTKRIWGSLAYARTAFLVAMTARSFRAEIRSEQGVASVKTLQIAVGNGRYFGGGMSVASDASIEDGRIELCSLECRRWWRLLWLASAIRLGHHLRGRDLRELTGTQFEVRTRHPLPVNADGEIVTCTPVTFRVVPAAIAVLVP
jgi:YegS/Rv2252/BmrU family lipid kinase